MMRYVDEYRDPKAAERLVERIRRRASRPWSIMEVCGGQTHGLLRSGIDQALEGAVQLIHGPGCPVCVTATESIDAAIELAHRDGTLLATFGDMLRVPGSKQSLLHARATGANVRAVYSPLDAVRLAREQPERQVVFFAVGFETTAPATALALLQAARLGLLNFHLLVAHVRVLPAMLAIASAGDCRVDGFLGAGHVCAITGFGDYGTLVADHGKPVVVTGFEPIDLLLGIEALVEQLESGVARIENRYERGVRMEGNERSLELINRVYQVEDRVWRGMGTLPKGGLGLRPEYQRFDALRLLDAMPAPSPSSGACRSAEVLAGRLTPPACPAFGNLCRPEHPLGAPMVSNEGACAAYFHYRLTPAREEKDR